MWYFYIHSAILLTHEPRINPPLYLSSLPIILGGRGVSRFFDTNMSGLQKDHG